MAIINCPGCNRKTSEISSRCPHCGFDRDTPDNDRLMELQRRRLRDRIYHLNMTSYAVITLFLAAFGWYWWDTGGFQHRSGTGPLILLGIAALGYLVIRMLLFAARKQMRRARRQG
jgi:hypothetical protein